MARQSLNTTIASAESRRQAAVERMWLSYYNNTLLEKGIITPEQHRKMQVYINSRKVSSVER